MYFAKDIIFPKFIVASISTNDPFWKSVLEDLSYGICPKGVFISNGNMCCCKKTERILYNIESETLSSEEIINFLQENTSLRSQKEKCKVFLELSNCNDKSDVTSWMSIKKKSLKDVLIERFVISTKKKNNLSYKKAREFRSLILTSLAFKHIKPSDICIENGEITEISQLSEKFLDSIAYTNRNRSSINRNMISTKSK
jgi:hypothetical protein